MRDILKELDIDFVEDEGEAAFYGPKVDINARNVYGKDDTMITDPVGCTFGRAV